MQIINPVQKVLKFVGLCSVTNKYLRFGQQLVYWCVFITLVIMTSTSGLYVLEALKIGDMENSMFAGFQMAAALCDFGSVITMVHHKDSARKILEELQTLYDHSMEKTSGIHFARANRLSGFIFKWAEICIVGSFWFTSIGYATGQAIFFYFREEPIIPAKLYLPYKIILPFNGHTFPGWFSMMASDLFLGGTYAITNITITSFFVSLGLFFQACSLHYKTIFDDMSKMVTQGEKDHRNMVFKLEESLIEAIEYHKRVKQIFIISCDVMSGTIFTQLSIGVLYMAVGNFQMEVVVKARDFNIIFLSLVVIMSTGSVFVYCYIGTLTTDQFFKYGDMTYESIWYRFPTRLQKYLQLVIADAHRPCVYQGFNLMDLHLMTFTRVTKTAFTYYLMLKKRGN